MFFQKVLFKYAVFHTLQKYTYALMYMQTKFNFCSLISRLQYILFNYLNYTVKTSVVQVSYDNKTFGGQDIRNVLL